MRKPDKKKLFVLLLLLVYLVLLVYLLFFSETYGRTTQQQGYRYNLIPFREIGRYLFRVSDPFLKLLNLLGNIIAFLPFGFLLPVLDPQFQKWWRILLNTFSLSVSVEAVQLLTMVGTFDVDDLILNTAGGMLGYALFVLLRKRR